MPPKQASGSGPMSKKRKLPLDNVSKHTDTNKRPKMGRRMMPHELRQLSTQTSSRVLKNGEIDVDKFVKAREFEIRALEEGMARSRKVQNERAFQQVPKELRRRTASHNVKRVPKRLRARAKREMIDDNTPTVTARRRKPNSRLRLRLETAKRLRALGTKRKCAKDTIKDDAVKITIVDGHNPDLTKGQAFGTHITTRAPKIKKGRLTEPPVPKAKFRKRQFNKTWLPTHMFHTKRAHMTPPKQPLWRFAIPLTPTAKSYRPTHRAANEKGAIAWDTSYMSTIGLDGQQRSLEGILEALRFGHERNNEAYRSKDVEKWRQGLRAMHSMVYEREAPHKPIAPVTIMWSVSADSTKPKASNPDHRRRKLLLRVQPSAFFQVWEELLRLAKIIKPQVSVEDLRFEIGSIEVSGPSATEALLSALWPSPSDTQDGQHVKGSVEETWGALVGLTNPAMLPANVLLGFDIQDPRLHHPPRSIEKPSTERQQIDMMELLAVWPADRTQGTQNLFDRTARLCAASALPSQRSVSRRKALANPGQYPSRSPGDPNIPLMIYTTDAAVRGCRKWVLLLPWKCVQPVWYSIMYYPLTTGGQPKFGGLQEQRQLAYEAGIAWFPADFPGTKAGWEWEMQEREKRRERWESLPKSKRTNWESVDLGKGRKGEIGLGWACDWQVLCRTDSHQKIKAKHDQKDYQATTDVNVSKEESTAEEADFVHLTNDQVRRLFKETNPESLGVDLTRGLTSIRIDLLCRGVPDSCARIYRLPLSGALRDRWLALHPAQRTKQKARNSKIDSIQTLKDTPPHVVQRRLAQSLLEPLRAGDEHYPHCPGEEDLIGFVTTGNFNLGEGRATGIGCVLVEKVLEQAKTGNERGRLCVIRNAGTGVGRLARWQLA